MPALTAGMDEPAQGATPAPRRPWRDRLETMVMAVVMALFLKQFVIEAFKIPSGSMQPTLIGDPDAGIEDRILVDKLAYLLRDPARWDVAVFHYPLDRSKSFVKRIAGVGPEELRIKDGDVWCRRADGPWEVARRPRAVQDAMWLRVDVDEPEVSPWQPQNLPRSSSWEATGRSIVARGSGSVVFRGGGESILDDWLDGYGTGLRQRVTGAHRQSRSAPVGDLKVAGVVRALPGLDSFTIVLREGRRHYRFELPGPAAAPEARATIDAGPFVIGGTTLDSTDSPEGARLVVDRPTHIAAWNLDDRLELEIDGRLVAACDVQATGDQNSSIHLTIAGEGADLSSLAVWRDVYYLDRSNEPVVIPAGSYFMLGDNTQDSSDSREWSFAVLEVPGEEGEDRALRGNWRDGENPRVVAPGAADGPLTRLVDEWGEVHLFRRGESRRLPPEYAPFVPRELIQGRALAVFWPLNPLRELWRLKWVR
jgi:signal peptidase I